MEIIKDIQNAYLPELILFIFIIINIILSLLIRKNTYKIAKIITITSLMLSGLSIFFIQINPTYLAFNNVYISNIYTTAFKILILISGLFTILASNSFIREKRQKSFEFFAIYLAGILSSFSLVSSNDFISTFISLELLSVCCYFLTSFRKNHKSQEAAFKYLITGASSSAILLLGISYLYGITGNINYSNIYDTLYYGEINIMFIVSCLLIICGLTFKIGCIPFNNWILDIYEGANYSICAYLSLIPKIAAIGLISRLFVQIFSYSPFIQILTALIALYSIIYSVIGAINQKNIKRLYAYSSIIHGGFLLLALSTTSVYGLSCVIFYIFTYIFMNIGIWSASIIHTTEYQSDAIDDYKGIFYKHPYYTIALTICLLSLAGLPPTSGFLAKLYLFSSLSRGDFIYLFILFIALCTTVLGIFVYFKIIKVLYEKPDTNISITKYKSLGKIILYLCCFITILIGIFPNEIVKITQIIAYYI